MAFTARMNPCPFKARSFSAACQVELLSSLESVASRGRGRFKANPVQPGHEVMKNHQNRAETMTIYAGLRSENRKWIRDGIPGTLA